MASPSPHFDVAALCEAVHEQDLGLHVTTNNPGGFRRLVYAHGRKHPSQKIHVYSKPGSPNGFILTKDKAENLSV